MNYQLHDLSKFPFVFLKSEACAPGFAEQWGHEMDALVTAARPFVVAFEPAAIEEEAQDFRTRAQWFKHHRQTLGAVCAGMVAIVPSSAERESLQADLVKRSRGLGVTYVALGSMEEAAAASSSLLVEHMKRLSISQPLQPSS